MKLRTSLLPLIWGLLERRKKESERNSNGDRWKEYEFSLLLHIKDESDSIEFQISEFKG